MNNQLDISSFGMTELKALAFDLFGQRSNIDANLKVVNDRMVELAKQAEMQTPGEVIAEVSSEPTADLEQVVENTETIDKTE